MRIIFLFSTLLITIQCTQTDTNEKRKEILEIFQFEKETLDKEIEELTIKSKQAIDEAKSDIEVTLLELKKQRKEVVSESNKLKKASKKELSRALKETKKTYKQWLKEKKKAK